MIEYDTSNQTSNGKILWKREDVASIIIDFSKEKEKLSQRQFSLQNDISRTSLQHWLSRKKSLDASPLLIEFFESPVGIAFLHRMLTAAQYEFCHKGPASIHNVSNFLKLCGLSPFVASSYSAQRKVSNDMDKNIVKFGEIEGKRLAEKMPTKWISLCEDETFHPAICMVAIDANSNFIILEEYVQNRDGETWNRVVGKALQGLPVEVIQVTSDEATGLINHTEKGLGAHHSPDIFHVSYEIVRGTSGALAGKVKKAEKQLETAEKHTQREKQNKERFDNQPKRPPGRRPHFEKKIKIAEEKEYQTQRVLDTARKNQETVKQSNRKIGKCYHPYDPETGKKQDSERISELLESCFEEINGAITELSDRCKKRVEKAHRVVKGLVSNVAFFFLMIDQYMKNMEISEYERQLLNDYLIPGFYLQEVARKEKDEIRKEVISDKSGMLLSILSNQDGPLAGYSDNQIKALEKAAKECAGIFQRSSSRVEGRNAQLSLRHHGIHRLSPLHLKALTVVHNYDIKNRDGTTPAEGFFEAEHNDLFEWLLDNMDYPSRPRKRLSKAA